MVDMVIITVVVMVVMVIGTDRTTRTHGTNKTDRITRTNGTHKTVRITRTRDRQDRQIWHLNLTFQVTCVGQLSQFLEKDTTMLSCRWPVHRQIIILIIKFSKDITVITITTITMIRHPGSRMIILLCWCLHPSHISHQQTLGLSDYTNGFDHFNIISADDQHSLWYCATAISLLLFSD